MATPRSLKHAFFVLLTAAVAAVGLFPAASKAEPTKSLAEVQREVDALNAKLDAAIEQYNQSRIALSAASRRTVAAERRAAREEQAVNATAKAMSQVAVAAYRSGGMDQFASLVSAKDPQAYLDQASSLDSISGRQADALTAMRAARVRYAQAQAVAAQELSKQQAVAKTLKGEKDGIEAALARQQQLLGSLKASERARLAALAKARAPKPSQRPSYHGPASGAAAVAVRYAYNQIGKPYSWGASGPSSYDCSGLTMASWAAAGVSLPHSSAAQYNSGRHVSQSELQPGDLLFYGSPIHHVSIYIGGGRAIDAPHSGAYVRIEDSPFRSDYVGATRP